jgi:pimeloyl-ACP methyl ester carboxylesterase
MTDRLQETRILVLVVRGWGDAINLPLRKISGGELPEDFLRLIRETLPGADVQAPALDMGTRSKADPAQLVDQLLDLVDERFRVRPFDKLLLVAFSAGTVLARNFFSRAQGAQRPADRPANVTTVAPPWSGLPRLDPTKAKPWAEKIERIVYLAGVTRGWSLSSATPAMLRFLAPILLFFLNSSARLQGKDRAFIESFKRGAPFVVESRLLYLQVERHFADSVRNMPQKVLLLGSKDEYVSPADALDLGIRKDFSYLEVPESSHIDILDVGNGDDSAERACQRRRQAQAKRAELIQLALTGTPDQLSKSQSAIHTDDLDDYLDEMDLQMKQTQAASGPEQPVKQIVLVIHGIRDNGFWTKRVAREAKTLARQDQSLICAPTPSYGFFSMLDFVNPWGRQDATYWFLERYAELRVHYPDVPISFIGHSNGTYLASRALELSPFVVFERILFAGSVVRTSFDWHRFSGRVRSVLNLVATRDVVVAFLPGAMERLRLDRIGIDVGGAGFYGFQQHEKSDEAAAEPRSDSEIQVQNFGYLAGGHGVGVSEPLWGELAAYAVRGELPLQPDGDPTRPRQRHAVERLIGMVAPAMPLLGLAAIFWLLGLLVASLQGWGLALVAAVLAIIINNVVRYY